MSTCVRRDQYCPLSSPSPHILTVVSPLLSSNLIPHALSSQLPISLSSVSFCAMSSFRCVSAMLALLCLLLLVCAPATVCESTCTELLGVSIKDQAFSKVAQQSNSLVYIEGPYELPSAVTSTSHYTSFQFTFTVPDQTGYITPN